MNRPALDIYMSVCSRTVIFLEFLLFLLPEFTSMHFILCGAKLYLIVTDI